jgi:hypothetical protein
MSSNVNTYSPANPGSWKHEKAAGIRRLSLFKLRRRA